MPQNVLSKTQDIIVLSYSHYIDNIGHLEIVGEIQNVGTSTIERVALTAKVYDTNGVNIKNVTGYGWLSYMVPQQKSPFRLEIGIPEDSPDYWSSIKVSRIEFSVKEANETSNYLYSDFKTTVSSAGVSANKDDKGTFWVSGTIQNVGSKTASNLAVAAVYYNAAGTVVAVGRTEFLTPTNVDPSKTAMFKVGAYDTNQTSEVADRKIASYALFIQADSPLLNGVAPTATTPAILLPNGTNILSSRNLIYISVIIVIVIAVIVVVFMARKGYRIR